MKLYCFTYCHYKKEKNVFLFINNNFCVAIDGTHFSVPFEAYGT